MIEPTCTQCRYFTPAPTWIEPPAWGYCAKRLIQVYGLDAQDGQPIFTWSDDTCEDFELGSQSTPGG